MNNDKCKICGSSDLKITNWGNTELIYCQKCKVNYLKKTNTPEELMDLYENKYTIINSNTFEEFYRFNSIYENNRLILNLLKFNDKIHTALDFGSYKSYFLDELRRYGIKVTGIELSQNGIDYSDNISIKTYKDIKSTDENYDLITFHHSFEHLTNPLEILSQAKAKLNDKGILMIRVPNFGSFWSKFLKENWIWFQSENHYFHYNLETFDVLLKNENFKILESKSNKPIKFMDLMLNYLNLFYFKTLKNKNLNLKLLLGPIYKYFTCSEIYIIAQKNEL